MSVPSPSPALPRLQQALGCPIVENVSLAPFTTWHIGGPARFLAEPATANEIVALADFATKEGMPLTVIGRGSNILVHDEGIPGVTLLMRRTFGQVERLACGTLQAQAGCPLPRLARFAGSHTLAGYEFLIGIPGTVGAGVAINAGTGGRHGPSIADVLLEADVLDPVTGQIAVLSRDELAMAYRATRLLHSGRIVLQARFRDDVAGDANTIRERQAAILGKRSAQQPLGRHTSGSIYKQIPGGHPAGWYIDRAGLKGFRVNGASVSTKHANWIENAGNATARDTLALMETVEQRVLECFGVKLEREVIVLPSASRPR